MSWVICAQPRTGSHMLATALGLPLDGCEPLAVAWEGPGDKTALVRKAWHEHGGCVIHDHQWCSMPRSFCDEVTKVVWLSRADVFDQAGSTIVSRKLGQWVGELPRPGTVSGRWPEALVTGEVRLEVVNLLRHRGRVQSCLCRAVCVVTSYEGLAEPDEVSRVADFLGVRSGPPLTVPSGWRRWVTNYPRCREEFYGEAANF